MKIRLKTAATVKGGLHPYGSLLNVSEEEAERLVGSNQAEYVGKKPKPEPPKPKRGRPKATPKEE